MRDKSDKSSTSSTAGPTGASTSVVGGELALREKLAKQAESGDDKVQVVFVLRPAPVPAASAATAADGAPAAAAQPAAPADPATAKPR
jgi:hypothetical protein